LRLPEAAERSFSLIGILPKYGHHILDLAYHAPRCRRIFDFHNLVRPT
jgi:hypothetical protein